MEWFEPLSARVTVVAAKIAPPAGEMVGSMLVTGVMVAPVLDARGKPNVGPFKLPPWHGKPPRLTTFSSSWHAYPSIAAKKSGSSGKEEPRTSADCVG